MRVAIVTNNYTPYKGGLVSSINAFVAELQQQGIPVIVITFGFSTKAQDPAWVHRIWSPCKFSYRGNPMVLPWRMQMQLVTIIDNFQPTVVHVQHPFLLGPAARDIAKERNIPVLFTYHTQYGAFAHYVPLLPTKLLAHLIHRQVDAFCNSVDTVIVPTQSIAEQLQQRGVNRTLTVLPSPLLPVFAAMPVLAKKLHVPIRLLTVTRLVPEKNLWPLIELVAHMPEVELTIAGFGYLHQDLARYAYHHHKISPERLRFIISPAHEQLVTLYQESDFFVFASHAETQGLVLAESMAGGCPVIAFKAPGSNDIVQDGVNGYLVHSITQMQQAILRIQQDPALYQQLVRGAYATAAQYHAAALTEQLLATYRTAIEKGVVGSCSTKF